MTWIFASAMAQATTLCPIAVEQGWREVDGMLLGPESGDLRYAADPAAQHEFGRVLAALRARGIEVVVAVVPPRSRVVLAPGGSVSPQESWLEDRARYVATLEWLRDQGAYAPDLLAVGLEMRAGGQQMFRPEDGHWTGEGSRAAAAAVAAEVRRAGTWEWLGSAPQSLVVSGVDRPRPGALSTDLAKVCGTAPTAFYEGPAYALESGGGGVGLLDDVPAPRVVVVSSSFGNPMFFFPQALEAELDAPILNISIASGRVTSALRAWLESPDYTEDGPDVLVWLFTATHLFAPSPVHSGSLRTSAGYRQILPQIDGGCAKEDAARVLKVRADGTFLAVGEPPVPSGGHYFQIEGDELRPLRFSLHLGYEGGATEIVALDPDERIPLRVRSLVEPRQDARPVVSARLDLPQGTALDQVTVHVCRYRASGP